MVFGDEIGEITVLGKSDDKCCLEWRIPKFLSLSRQPGDYYGSPNFNFGEEEWYFDIFPKGIYVDGWTDWMQLVLSRYYSPYPTLTLDVTVGIRGPEGVRNRKRRMMEFSEDEEPCIWRKFCWRPGVEDPASKLLLGDDLVLTIDAKRVAAPSVTADASVQTDSESEAASASLDVEVSTEKKQDACVQTDSESEAASVSVDVGEVSSEKKQGVEKIAEDLGKLLVSAKKSDVTLLVRGTEFKVHSAILSARSPVLSAMLEHDTAERASGEIRIDDCDPGVFEKYLSYLYTGSAGPLTPETVFGLHAVADKYLAEDLRAECLEHVRDTLCVRTFCDAVKLALTHGEGDLLRRALDFAKENMRHLVVSVEWQRFACEHPREANEILVKYFWPSTSKSDDE